jgi:transposase
MQREARALASIRGELERYSHERRISHLRLARRFGIMVLRRAGLCVRLCAWLFRCSPTTVRRWSGVVERTEQLLDRKRPGRVARFTEALRLRLVAFYCQNPLPGCRTWSLSWAAKYLNEHLQILGRSISPSTIGRILKSHSLRPHLVRYFLHVSDPLFFPKMERLIQLYLHPPPYLFCFDECTGLQALERIGVTMNTDHGIKTEFEYKRHGTRELCTFFEVASGKVFALCNDNHRQETLAEVLTEHIMQQQSDAVLHYICDNLAGHSTLLLCQTVAELAGVAPPSASTTAMQRKDWLQADDKRIIFHFTPFHGSWLNMVEIWFAILHKRCLHGRSFGSIDDLTEALHAFCGTWNEHFAHPFTWRYTGAGLAEKVVCRFTDWLLLEKTDMARDFLHKQLQLMTNLVADYWLQVPRKRWQTLLEALIHKHAYLKPIIIDDDDTETSRVGLLSALVRELSTNDSQSLAEVS